MHAQEVRAGCAAPGKVACRTLRACSAWAALTALITDNALHFAPDSYRQTNMRIASIASLSSIALCTLLGFTRAEAQVLDPLFSHQFEDGSSQIAPALAFARVGAGSTTGIGAPLT